MVCMVSGVCFREADTCLNLLVLVCRGGGLYVICAKSVTVSLPLHHRLVQIDASYKVWTGR